jgi:hypothetical protein
MTVWDQLSAPFDHNLVHWRPGRVYEDKGTALALAYLDARDIMERLDAVVGPENWEDTYKTAGAATVCELRIRIETKHGYEWIKKSDGSGESNFEGEKGAISGALKRAAVKFGIGRYLYYIPKGWMFPVEKFGKDWYFTFDAKRKMTNDLGAWQRDYFAINSSQPMNQPQRTDPPKAEPAKQEPVRPQPQPAARPTATTAANGTPASQAQLDEAYKEFLRELSNANAARRQENLGQLGFKDIVEHLHQMNYMNTPAEASKWTFIRDMGMDCMTAMTRELANQPTLIGDKVPF